MTSQVSKLLHRWALAPLLGILVGCGAGAGPIETAPDGGDDLAVQHLATLRVIEHYRRQSAARYDSLVAAWKARGARDGPMRASAEGETFVPCAPLPFDAEAQIVGPAGGVFQFGPHRLQVPAGALSTLTSIGVMVTSALKSEVVLTPHGLQFAAPVRLTLAYGHCDPVAAPRVAYIDDED
jgi:hypothetical protein